MRKLITVILSCAGIMLAVIFSAECSRGILSGILFCVQALVPSLFIFTAVSAFTVRSGAAVILSKPLHRISEALFGLPYPALAVIIMSMIGGYPIGAVCARTMYGTGGLSARQAEKTACIAVCAGPGFLINFVGRALLGCPDAGFLLLIAQTASTLITGIIAGKALKSDGYEPSETKSEDSVQSGNILIDSVTDASSATFKMCSMVIVCSAMIEIIQTVSPSAELSDISAALLEITTGCGRLCGRYPLTPIAFFIGFGGLSVHLQIFAAMGELRINKGLFFVFRIIQGIICSALTYILLMIFPLEISVFNSSKLSLTASGSVTPIGSAALILCSLFFLGSVNKAVKRLNRR